MTTITGKDSPLETTIEKIDISLKNHGIDLDVAAEFNPVPHCFSVHLQARDYDFLYTNGKGTNRLASLASGMAEFIERLATDFFFADFYLGYASSLSGKSFSSFPDEVWYPIKKEETLNNLVNTPSPHPLLTPALLEFYSEEGELPPHALIDNNFDGNSPGICALPFTRQRDGKEVYFPISLLNNLYVSNGMAAGNSKSESQAQALSEIIERYVKNIVIAGGLALPAVPDETLLQFSHLGEIKRSIEQHGFHVTVYDSSLGGKFPVICVILIDQESGGTYAAFGANCRFEIAIERTLTELLQGRNLNQLKNFTPPVHNQELVAAPYNLESHFIDSDGLLSWGMFKDKPDFTFTPWSFNGTTSKEKNLLLSTIAIHGFDTYIREYTHCGLYSCRILVPGMSEIYPVDDLLWNNKNKGAQLRNKLLRLKKMNNKELCAILQDIEDYEIDDLQLVSQVIGVLFDRGSNWENLRIGELKAHLFLALGRTHEALEWCNWTIDYAELKEPRKRIFRAVATLIQFVENDEASSYEKGIQKFFIKNEIATAKAIISTQVTFHGLAFASTWQKISSAHRHLLELYDKLKQLKAPL